MASKGNANRQTLSDRMKEYEAVITSTTLMKKLPLYARLDLRAGHTFCKGLDKPFDKDFSSTMHNVTKHLVDKLSATVGYTQSDEISLVWKDASHVPFENRLFKLESVFAGMASAAFVVHGCKTKLKDRIEKFVPAFDCRVMNMPSLEECANMLMWREQDSIKNSITLLALEHFSNKQIHKIDSDGKVKMLADIGVDYYKVLAPELRKGAYFTRETIDKALSNEDLAKIPEKHRPLPNDDGKVHVFRSEVKMFWLNGNLSDIDMEKKVKLLFNYNEYLEEQKKTYDWIPQ